jgi:hypothetical protein
MPDNTQEAFQDAFDNPDPILSLLISGIARAQERFNSRLRTVDENGNPITEKLGPPNV